MIGEEFYECGICGHYHRWEFKGDCREDKERFTFDQLPEGADIYEWDERCKADQYIESIHE